MITPRAALLLVCFAATAAAAPVSLFDGQSLAGWEGETNKVWRVRNGVIAGGSLDGNPRNEFLATLKSYKNFHLRLDYKLTGTQGFVNSGVQFRSQRIANPPRRQSDAHPLHAFVARFSARHLPSRKSIGGSCASCARREGRFRMVP